MISQVDRIINPLNSRKFNSNKEINELFEIIKQNEESIKSTEVPNNTIKDFLFIIMAMLDNEPVLDDIHYTLKRVSESYSLKPERVDDSFGLGQINLKILNHIKLAEFIIADLTFERPNCYYEIGYAHALNKKVILTAKKRHKNSFRH